MSNNTGNTLLALLTGAAIGAGVGILFAPDKGSKTRGKIKEGYNDAQKDLVKKYESFLLTPNELTSDGGIIGELQSLADAIKGA